MAPTAHIEPGVVDAQSAPIHGLLDIGRYPSGIDETATTVAAALSGSGFESVPRADIMRWKYTKLLMNLGNAVDATCRPGEDAGELVRRARAEGVATLDAAGIEYASREEDRARRADLLTVRPIEGAMPRRRVELAEPRPRYRRDRGRLPQRRDRVGGPVSGTRHTRERGALRAREADGP